MTDSEWLLLQQEKSKKYYTETKERRKKREKEYYEANKVKIKEYHDKNKKTILEDRKEYYEVNKIKIKEYQKGYRNENRDKYRSYIRNRTANDITFKVKCNISCLIRNVIKKGGYTKKTKTFKILGCSFEDFKTHIESQFEDWMSWDNYGKYEKDKYNVGWDFDHIEPLQPKGIKRSEEDIVKLNHYTNFRPLCSKINRDEKRNNIILI